MTPIEEDPAKGLNAAVAAELRAERAATRITFDELAARTGISRRTILRLMNAERAITTSYLETLTEELGVNPVSIIERALARQAAERRKLSEVPPSVDRPEEFDLAASTHEFEDEQPGSDEPA